MREEIAKIYEENKDDLQMFNFHPDEEDDEKRNCYVYAWFVKNDRHAYFYIGKGKNTRYKHILKEIDDVENNPRKYKGIDYKILKDNIGIDHEFLYDSLTEAEASVMEAYSILTYMRKKEPLLNVILPSGLMEDEELMEYRDKYFYYKKNIELFLSYYL